MPSWNLYPKNIVHSLTELFSSNARIGSMAAYQELYAKSIGDPEGFWAEAAEELHWFRKWDRVLNTDEAPFYKWYEGAQTNLSYNCLDRHIEAGLGDKAAIHWVGEPGDGRDISYRQLLSEVNRFANVLKKLGVRKGDRVALYLPMIPELAVAVLACARIGAVHSVIFAGFSSDSIRDRVLDMKARMLITADAGYRRGKVLELKKIVDAGISSCDCLSEVLVVKRGIDGLECPMTEGRDIWYEELSSQVDDVCPAEAMDAEDLLFLLYTSGTTGKPKGIMHTTAGYMVFTYLTSKYVFDLARSGRCLLVYCGCGLDHRSLVT